MFDDGHDTALIGFDEVDHPRLDTARLHLRVAVLAVAAVWWQLGPSSVSCYYASYDPDTERTFGETAAKMWPTRWFWIGMIGAPTLAGAVFIGLTSRDA